MKKNLFVTMLIIIFLPYCSFNQNLRKSISYSEMILPNGLHVIISPQKDTQFTTVLLGYKVGGYYESNDILGISHLLEHLMFKSSKNLKTGEFNKILEKDLGGSFNAMTTYDATIYYSTVPSKHLEKVLELEAERMKNLTFDPKEVAKEKLVVLEEMRNRVENSDMGYFIYKSNQAFYKDANYPYGRDLGGSKAVFDKLSIHTIKNYYKTYYSPNNAFIIITGEISNTRQVERLVRKYFHQAKPSDIPTFPLNITFKAPKGKITFNRKTQTNYALLMAKINSAKSPLTPAFILLGNLLTANSNSYLTKSLLREKQLVSSISAGPDITKLDSNFSIFFNPYNNEDVPKIKQEIINILNQIKKDPKLKEKIEEQRLLNKTSFLQSLQKSDDLAFNLMQGAILNNEPLFYISLELKKLSESDVITAIDFLLNEEFTTFTMPKT
jgi:zinc protease